MNRLLFPVLVCVIPSSLVCCVLFWSFVLLGQFQLWPLVCHACLQVVIVLCERALPELAWSLL